MAVNMENILLQLPKPAPKAPKPVYEPHKIEIASDETYWKHTQKGLKLYRTLEDPRTPGYDQPSSFDSQDLLDRWGWTDETEWEGGVRYVQYSSFNGIGGIVKHDQGVRTLWEHTGESQIGIESMLKDEHRRYPVCLDWNEKLHILMKQKQVTFAKYETVVWPFRGVILATHSESPEYMVKERYKSKGNWSTGKCALPELQRWSDVVYLTWMQQTAVLNADPSNLQYVFHRRIKNQDTLQVLGYVLQLQDSGDDSDHARAPTWPNKQAIHRPDRGFSAMLYTPCVRGTVKLLTQHRKVFGKRYIRAITAYQEDNGPSYEPTLMIEIANVGGR